MEPETKASLDLQAALTALRLELPSEIVSSLKEKIYAVITPLENKLKQLSTPASSPTAEAILDKHISVFLSSPEHNYHSLEEIKKEPEYKITLLAMLEFGALGFDAGYDAGQSFIDDTEPTDPFILELKNNFLTGAQTKTI